MDNDWAVEHLQTIRTLMERAAIYRRALAPIMLLLGSLGTLAGLVGWWLPITNTRAFGAYWFGVALVALAGAFLLARRQALKDHEAFWSPPTRRVAQALLPPFASGLCLAMVCCLNGDEDMASLFVLLCGFFYGCAVHAAGFFMPRGMKLFGWTLITCTVGVLLLMWALKLDESLPTAHLLMGFLFGVLHLAYGSYLWITERQKQTA